MPIELADTTLRMLDDLPPFLAGAKDSRGTLDSIAREIDRFDYMVGVVRDNVFPQRAEAYLSIYEAQFGLSIASAGKTLDQRRNSVLAAFQAMVSTGSGLDWVSKLTRLIGSGWTYEEHVNGDMTTPDANIIRITLPFTPEISTPSGLTATPGSSGSLASGTYHYKVTASNFYGETLPTGDVTATVSASGKVTLNWSDVTNATSYSVYRGTSSSNHKRLAVNLSTSDFIDDGTGTADGPLPPTSNTTESFQSYEARVFARKVTPAHLDLEFGYAAGFILGIGRLGEVL